MKFQRYNIHMTIYIEEFILQNVLINICLLRLVQLTLKPQGRFLYILISCIIGAIFSVVSAVFIKDQILMNTLKILCSVTMILIAFRQPIKQTIVSIILLFMYTYALGGAIVSIGNLQFTEIGIISFSKVNLYYICLGIIILSYVFEMIARNITLRIKSNRFIYEITLKHNNKKLTINAYLDTGNLLNLDGKPIIVVDVDIYLKLMNMTLIDFYLKKSIVIPTGTIAGNDNIKIFTIDEVFLKMDKKTITLRDQYIAINTTNNFKNTNYKALLSPMLI